MPARRVTLLPGDGVGPEVAAATRRLLADAGAEITWEEALSGRAAVAQTGSPLPPETIASIRKNRVALKGRIFTPVGEGYESPNVSLRKALDLFAAVRPIQTLPGMPSRYQGVDLVVIRECTEDVYAGIEHRVVPGVIQSLKVTTQAACRRIVRYAFGFARRHGRKQVTLVHKANIMKRSDGLFMRCGEEIAAEYPEIEFKTIIADNACMQMVRDPRRFDVLVAQNLFGDLLSDLGAGIVGGIAAVASVLRDETDLHVFEAIHGLAPELEGKGIANPLPFLRPALRMLRHLGQPEVAKRIEDAVAAALTAGIATPDLGGRATTESFVDEVIRRLAT